MKLIVAAIFAVLAVSAYAEEPMEIDWSTVVPVQDLPGFWDGRELQPAKMPEHMKGRIVGGTIVSPPNSRPHQAGCLMSFAGGTGLCGGSILTNRAILTAAHCPIGSSSTQVVLGAHQINIVEGTQLRITVQSGAGYRIHASYNPSNLNNDIAILITPGHFGHNVNIQPIQMAAAGAGTFAGQTATVTGWGRIADGSTATSPHLRTATLPVITNAVCSGTFGGIIIASTLCCSTGHGQGTCNGDSGGPLVIGPIQVGVVSFGAAAGCQQGFPVGFARVSSFAGWIATNSIP